MLFADLYTEPPRHPVIWKFVPRFRVLKLSNFNYELCLKFRTPGHSELHCAWSHITLCVYFGREFSYFVLIPDQNDPRTISEGPNWKRWRILIPRGNFLVVSWFWYNGSQRQWRFLIPGCLRLLLDASIVGVINVTIISTKRFYQSLAVVFSLESWAEQERPNTHTHTHTQLKYNMKKLSGLLMLYIGYV